uniref:Uncharacterized protein n=1 Tax=Trichinella nativa TaxID=6335 RepID=A0A0V1KHX3_9BILA
MSKDVQRLPLGFYHLPRSSTAPDLHGSSYDLVF